MLVKKLFIWRPPEVPFFHWLHWRVSRVCSHKYCFTKDLTCKDKVDDYRRQSISSSYLFLNSDVRLKIPVIQQKSLAVVYVNKGSVLTMSCLLLCPITKTNLRFNEILSITLFQSGHGAKEPVLISILWANDKSQYNLFLHTGRLDIIQVLKTTPQRNSIISC